MFASLILRQADLATTVEWIEIHFDIYIYRQHILTGICSILSGLGGLFKDNDIS